MDKEQKNRLLEELFEHATESIIITNEEGIINLINPATVKLFGYSFSELTGKTVEYLMPERFSARHQHNRAGYNKNPHARSMGIGMDLFGKKKDGSEFPVEISLTPFRSNDHISIIAFVIDITKRKKIEGEIIRQQKTLEEMTVKLKTSNEALESKVQDRTKILQEALTEVEKSRIELSEALEKEKELNELKSRFLSMASHEFRTPLTAILSSASLIEDYHSSEQQERRMKHVERIKSAVNNLNDILSDFLSISKIEEGKVMADFRTFNLNKLADEICMDMKGLTKPGQLIVHEHAGEENIQLDPKLVKNILINLVSNALKFSDENKAVKVKTTVEGKFAKIVVQDEGMGISEDDQKHLYQRFFRGQNATNIQGTGLGLNIVANYVELMNGFIEMKSQLEKGTTFTITFKNSTLK